MNLLPLICLCVLRPALAQFGQDATTPDPATTPGNILVIAPRTIRPDRPYSVSVNILNGRDDSYIVRVEVLNARNESIALKIEPNVRQGSPRTISLGVIDARRLVQGEYRLLVRLETLGGHILFENSESLTFDSKSLSIFVQTDKAAYKPGSKVRLRAVVIRPDLLPYNERVSIYVRDPSSNLIAQWTNETLTKGVNGQELELSDDPPLGDWRIRVQTHNGLQYEKTFSVEKYVLPKFEVTVEPPSFVTLKDDIEVLVKAKYTYGKGVQGPVKIIAEPSYPFWHRPDPVFLEIRPELGGPVERQQMKRIEKNAELNNMGEYSFRFTNAELRRNGLYDENISMENIKFTAVVTEALTKIQRNATAEVTAHQHDVKLSLEKSTETYKPGLDYHVMLSVKRQDDTPITPNAPLNVQVKEIVNWPYDHEANTHQEAKTTTRVVRLDADGTKLLTIKPPKGSDTMTIEARYDRTGGEQYEAAQIHANIYINPSKSPTDNFIQLQSTSDSVNAGQTVTFNVRATDNIQHVTAQVMARGRMVHTQNLQLSNNMGQVSLTTDEEMAPKARIVVYGIREDNKEILVDAMDFKVEGMFKNKVQVSMSRNEAQPGESVTVRVRADAGSLVALLAVDQSVLLHKSGNDITADMVESDIASYSTSSGGGGPSPPWLGGPFRARRKRSIWWPYWLGGKDAKSVFESAGMVVLTDAYLYSEPIPPRFLFLAKSFLNDEGMMDRSGEGPSNLVENVVKPTIVRRKFPETWIWTSDQLATKSNGQAEYEAKVPDTITSWITSAFAVSDSTGLGVAPSTAKLRVFRPFFIQLNLPYSVKRHEQMALQVLVFNYESNVETVELTLRHDANSGFDFVTREGGIVNINDPNTDQKYKQRVVKVPGNGGSISVSFPIVPTLIGKIKLHVTARGTRMSDAVERPLLVEPEGFRVDQNRPVVIDLSDQTSFSKTVELKFPVDAVEGSQAAEVNVAGDIMGPVLSNIEGLVRMPYGCGEQNMVNFVPNIVVMNYLKATQREERQLMDKALNFMKRGYQRELTYRRDDSSFSAFGDSDDHGSTWLTAFVLRSFKQAEKHIFVDPEVLKGSIEYLQKQQAPSGEFTEHGKVHHQSMQGGASQGGVPMTAYVTLAMLENQVSDRQAIQYLENNLNNIRNEPYSLAVTAYALHLANSARKDEAWNMLVEKAIQKDGQMHWSDQVGDEEEDEESRSYWAGPRSVDVEMTSYALLTLMVKNDLSAGLPIVRWLTAKRNPTGGWANTQDTVVALQALAAYAEKAYSPSFNVDVKVRSGANEHTFSIRPQNALVFQSYELSDLNSPVVLEASGSGVVFAQVQWRYHMTKQRDDQPFSCEQDVLQTNDNVDMVLSLCCRYQKRNADGSAIRASNMAVLEVDALSGYQIDLEQLQQMTTVKHLQRVETEKDDSKANIYFDEITTAPVCVNVTSQLVYQVSDQRDAQMVLYDYYSTGDRLTGRYSARQKRSLQQVCSDCWSNLVTAGNQLPKAGALSGAKLSSRTRLFVWSVTLLVTTLTAGFITISR